MADSDTDNEDPGFYDFHVESHSSSRLQAGACTACGPRPTNEDQHVMLCDWCPMEGTEAGLFAVLDGHGGFAVSILVSKLLARKLRSVLEEETCGIAAWASKEGRKEAVERAFLELDTHLSQKRAAFNCGSTCTAAIIWRDDAVEGSCYRVLLANLGDSRGLIVQRATEESGWSSQLVGETEDHKPDDALEERRIIEAGGHVSRGYGCPRVCGDLALSRAFGDFRLKDHPTFPPHRQKVSSVPDIYEFECRPGDAVVLACDGAYDVLRSSEVAEIAFSALLPGGGSGRGAREADAPAGGFPKLAAQTVVRTALDRGTMDNVTCVVVHINEAQGLECPDPV